MAIYDKGGQRRMKGTDWSSSSAALRVDSRAYRAAKRKEKKRGMSEKEKGREVRGIVLKERSFGFCSVDSSSFQASYISSLLVRSLVRWLALEKEKLPTSAGPTFLVPRGLIHPRILNRPSFLSRSSVLFLYRPLAIVSS